MLWKKGWWDMRWIFLIGLAWIFGAYGLTFGAGDYDAGRWAARLHRSASLSESERQALNNYQGQAWALWFKMLLSFMCADLAVLLGAACLMTECPYQPSQDSTRMFTFSLPPSRRKVLLSQATVGFGQLFLAVLFSSLLIPIFARFNGQWFSWSDTLIYLSLTILGAAVFFCFAFLMTVILGNWFAVFVLVEGAVFALFLPYIPFRTRPWWNILGLMAGESYFYHGQIPWLGLLISILLSAVFMFAAIRIFERRDL